MGYAERVAQELQDRAMPIGETDGLDRIMAEADAEIAALRAENERLRKRAQAVGAVVEKTALQISNRVTRRLRARVEALEAALRERDGGDHDRECRIWMSNWQKREDRYCNCGHVEARALLEQKP